MFSVVGSVSSSKFWSDVYLDVVRLAADGVVALAKQAARNEQPPPAKPKSKLGETLRPGRNTPFWNALRAELRPFLRRYGTQARLGRVLGLPRQRVNEFVTRGGTMPDAERTLQLVAWLVAAKRRSEQKQTTKAGRRTADATLVRRNLKS